MSTFLIVGKGFSGFTVKILDRGDDYIILRDQATTRYPDKKLKRRVVADFSSKEALLASVEPLRGTVDAVITVYENYVLPAAWITEYLGLPGMPIAAAEACTDKELMREAFARAPQQISPGFSVVTSRRQLEQFAAAHTYPLILKPANLSKSLHVTKNHNREELLANYDRTMQRIHVTYDKYAPGRTPKLIVEEFLEGSIHSVDAFVDAKGTPHVLDRIVDYQTGYDIGFDDNFHFSRILPSALSEDEQKAFRETAALGCRALGMKSSPAHIEIIMTKSGPRIVEIGARNGGYRERMHRLANDLDLASIALDTALGLPPNITTSKNDPCAVLELFPKTPGIFAGIQNLDRLQQLESLNYFAIKQPLNEFVGKSSDGYKMCAVVVLHHHDPEIFARDLDYVTSHCQIITN